MYEMLLNQMLLILRSFVGRESIMTWAESLNTFHNAMIPLSSEFLLPKQYAEHNLVGSSTWLFHHKYSPKQRHSLLALTTAIADVNLNFSAVRPCSSKANILPWWGEARRGFKSMMKFSPPDLYAHWEFSQNLESQHYFNSYYSWKENPRVSIHFSSIQNQFFLPSEHRKLKTKAKPI